MTFTPLPKSKLMTLEMWTEYVDSVLVPKPISAVCESCGHKVTSYEPLPDSMPCPNCDRRIDLK